VDFRERSYWLSSREYVPSPPLDKSIAVDVAIIGGGFTGVSTAYHLKKLEPSLKVAVCESQVVGFGASGRNGGFAMTLFGLTMQITKFRFGEAAVLSAHRYMERAVDYVGELVQEHNLDCDYERPGFLRVATSEKYAERIKEEMALAQRLGIGGIEWIDAETLAKEVKSPLYLGAWWEPRCALVNPAKLAWEMKKVAQKHGVEFYENTSVEEIRRQGEGFLLKANGNNISCRYLVLATNAYSHLIPQLRRKQVPGFTRIVLTEPLGDRLKPIGWQNRQGIEDARNLVHYYRLTADNRLLMGGGDIGIAYGHDMEKDREEANFQHLEQHVVEIFPSLKSVRFTHRWGGPVAIPVDMAPVLGYLGEDKRAVYGLGYVGHGVAMSHYNGWTLAELLLGRETERTTVFFVNRKTIPWPPEPLRVVLSLAIRGYMRWEDKRYDPETN